MARRHRKSKKALQRCGDMTEVIEALGGRRAVLVLTGKRYNNLVNWIDTQKKFPARLYLKMTRTLHDRGYEASPLLWGIEPLDPS